MRSANIWPAANVSASVAVDASTVGSLPATFRKDLRSLPVARSGSGRAVGAHLVVVDVRADAGHVHPGHEDDLLAR